MFEYYPTNLRIPATQSLRLLYDLNSPVVRNVKIDLIASGAANRCRYDSPTPIQIARAAERSRRNQNNLTFPECRKEDCEIAVLCKAANDNALVISEKYKARQAVKDRSEKQHRLKILSGAVAAEGNCILRDSRLNGTLFSERSHIACDAPHNLKHSLNVRVAQA